MMLALVLPQACVLALGRGWGGWRAPTVGQFIDLDREPPERLGSIRGPYRIDRGLDGRRKALVVINLDDGLAQDDAILFDGDFQEHGVVPCPLAAFVRFRCTDMPVMALPCGPGFLESHLPAVQGGSEGGVRLYRFWSL